MLESDRESEEKRCLEIRLLVSRSIGLVSFLFVCVCCACVCVCVFVSECEKGGQPGTVPPSGDGVVGGHISRDVMVQAPLDAHRWVRHLESGRHPRAHTGGRTDQAAAERHGDKKIYIYIII